MAEVTLNQAVRNSLLSLQSTSKLIEQTQGRLSSGLRVAGPVDDPVAFFQAKGLEDRASDFAEKKDSIDQGISSVTAALDGVDAIETLVRQLKGVAQSFKSASATTITDLITQFQDLRTQIDLLAADASYQGVNLVNGTGTTLSVEFSQKSASKLDITSVNLTIATAGLNIISVTNYTGGFEVKAAASTAGGSNATSLTNGRFAQQTQYFTAGSTFNLTFEGLTQSYSAGSTISFQGETITTVSGRQLSAGAVIELTVASAGAGATSAFYVNTTENVNFLYNYASGTTGGLGTAITAGETLTLTYNGLTRTFTTADNGLLFTAATAIIGSGTFQISSGSVVLTSGSTFNITLRSTCATLSANTLQLFSTGFAATSAATTALAVASTTQYSIGNVLVLSSFTAEAALGTTNLVQAGDNTSVNTVITALDAALATLRTNASNLGNNVAVLQARFDFTEQYVNTLEIGGSKLVLADLNQEGANLLALQTRQQLGIQALSFAGQAEQGILALFN